MVQVDGDAPIVAIHCQEERALAVEQLAHRSETALPFARAGPFDLHDVGAHVSEELRGPRAHHHLREVENSNALERARHLDTPLRSPVRLLSEYHVSSAFRTAFASNLAYSIAASTLRECAETARPAPPSVPCGTPSTPSGAGA